MGEIDRIRAYYERRIRPGRASHDVLDWASARSQQKRFAVLADNVPLRGRSLLDVGCGLGDLAAFLDERQIPTDYTGVDVLAKMVDACRRRLPDHRFVQADVFAGNGVEPGRFDVTFCSGTFNLNLGNNLEFLPTALDALFALAREHVVFNLLHVRARRRGGRYFFYDPQEVLTLVRRHPCEVRLLDDYLPNDFTVICRQPGVPAAEGGDAP
jgi:SAM-dependent methyltransferase